MKEEIYSKFPLISYEELHENVKYEEVYSKVHVSIFEKVLTIDEAEKELSGTDYIGNKKKFIRNLQNLLDELIQSETFIEIISKECDENGNEIISFYKRGKSDLDDLILKAKENYLKIVANEEGFIFELVFDLSLIFHVLKDVNQKEIEESIIKNGLYIL